MVVCLCVCVTGFFVGKAVFLGDADKTQVDVYIYITTIVGRGLGFGLLV